MEDAIREIVLSVSTLRQVKSQLNNRLELLGEMDNTEALCAKGKEALEAIDNWEQELIQPKQKTANDVIHFEHRLASEINMLRNKVNSYDPRPTMGASERMEEFLDQWQEWNQEMQRIIDTELGEFNALYADGNFPALIVPAMEQ